MRRLILACCLLAVAPALADDDFPRSPKIGPPDALPEANCDTAKPSTGDWLLGRWVGPNARWSFERGEGGRLGWTLERKGAMNEDFGWRDGAVIGGVADAVSACTVHLLGDGGADKFSFDGVLIDGGKIYGTATNKAGGKVRFVLRRER
jgi:hypothetical protein